MLSMVQTIIEFRFLGETDYLYWVTSRHFTSDSSTGRYAM